MSPKIRNVVICLFRHRSRILVAPGYDDVKQEHFFRPLGGEIEFGELAVDALRREIREELGLEISSPAYLGALENCFEYRGQRCHEIAFVFDASFVDSQVYSNETIVINEPGWAGPAEWIDVSQPLRVPLFPTGIEELIRQQG